MANRRELYLREIDGQQLPEGVAAYEGTDRGWTVVVDGHARLHIRPTSTGFHSYEIGNRYDDGRSATALGDMIFAELERLTTRGAAALPEPGRIGSDDDSGVVPMWKIAFQGPRAHHGHTFFVHTETSLDAVKEWEAPFGTDTFVVTVTPMQVSADFLHDPGTFELRLSNAISQRRDTDITAYTTDRGSALALAGLRPFNNTRADIYTITSVHVDGYRTEPLARSHPRSATVPSVYELLAATTTTADTTTTAPTPEPAATADTGAPAPAPDAAGL